MSNVPAPPPLPLTPLDLSSSSTFTEPNFLNGSSISPNICLWDSQHPQVWEACARNNICQHEAPFRYKYQHFDSILQVGPTCGLVALSMLVKKKVTPKDILNISKSEGYSCNGEMFSCKNMAKLTEKVLRLADIDNVNYCVRTGGLYSDNIIERLLNGAVLLVPYDADCNHSPCLRHGHTAHWALVSGVMIIKNPADSYTADPGNIFVFARHGKSKYVALWNLQALAKSNKNLWEFSPKKGVDGWMYVLPEGGVGGENGLRNQYLLFEGFSEFNGAVRGEKDDKVVM